MILIFHNYLYNFIFTIFIVKKSRKISNLLKKAKSVFKKASHLERDLHTYGSAFNAILGSGLPREIKVKKLKHLKECVCDISEKSLSGITDPKERIEKNKEYKDLINKIVLAELLLSK